jgi:hypothetical protein
MKKKKRLKIMVAGREKGKILSSFFGFFHTRAPYINKRENNNEKTLEQPCHYSDDGFKDSVYIDKMLLISKHPFIDFLLNFSCIMIASGSRA